MDFTGGPARSQVGSMWFSGHQMMWSSVTKRMNLHLFLGELLISFILSFIFAPPRQHPNVPSLSDTKKSGWTSSLTKILLLSLLFSVIYFFCTCNISAPSVSPLSQHPSPRASLLYFLLVSTMTPPSTNFVKLKHGLFSITHHILTSY